MTDYKLKADTKTDKPNKLRFEGKIPAVVYGKNFENIAVSIPKIAFDRIFKEAGTSNLIEMEVGDDKFKTLIHDYQSDSLTGAVTHVDFLKINMKEKIHAEIPLTFTGDSTAVINLEGSLITPVDHIEIECLPADLPSEISVDISILDDFEKNIKVSDLNIPSGVEVLTDPEEIVVFVQAPRSEEELAELEEAVEENVEGIEVEHKGEEAPAEGEGTESTESEKPADEPKAE